MPQAFAHRAEAQTLTVMIDKPGGVRNEKMLHTLQNWCDVFATNYRELIAQRC